MKKYLFIFFLVLLSLSLSLSSFALGNTYVFSDVWNAAVFTNSIVLTDSDQSGELISAGILSLTQDSSSFEIGFDDSLDFKGIQYSGDRKSSFDVQVPINLIVTDNQTLFCDFYFLSTQTLNSFNLSLTGLSATSNVSIPVTLTEYSSGLLNSPTYSIYGGVSGYTEIYNANSVYKISISYNPSNTINIQSLVFNITLSSSVSGVSSFVLGAFGSTDLVSLPEGVEDYLADISNKAGLTNSRILALINEIRSLQTKIDTIVSSIGSSSSTTNNYYNQILNPSDDNSDTLAQLEEDLTAAKEELAEIKEVISSVPVPSSDDLFNTSTISDSEEFITNAFDDPDVQLTFSSLFSIPIFLQLLLAVGALATISYVLYGKR